MSVTELKKEMEILPDKDRRDLLAYLVHLEQAKDEEFLAEMTRRIDERERFVKWSEVESEFAPSPS